MADEQPLYRPLDLVTGEIRLLTIKLLDSSDDALESPILRAEMHHVSLDKTEKKYFALSYASGDSTPSKAICVNGKEIQIRENLYDFLIRYRECMTDQRDDRPMFDTVELSKFYKTFMRKEDLLKSEISEPSFSPNMALWIDALCIDQSNIDELNYHVPRIKEIYEKAWHVIIWLGNATDTSDEAMVFLQKARMKLGEDRIVNMFQEPVGGSNFAAWSNPMPDLDQWRAVQKLFDHPYWSRLGAVQELAFSIRHASVWCGRRQMHARSMAKVQRAHFGDEFEGIVVRDPKYARCDSAKTVPPSLVRGGPAPIKIGGDLSRRPRDLEIFGARSSREIMCINRARKTSLPHDMIYALYGCIVREPGDDLIVDYGRSVSQVYCDYIEYEVKTSKSWQIWQLLTEKKSKIPDLPSWAVDWTAEDSRHQIIPIRSTAMPLSSDNKLLDTRNFATMRIPVTLLPPSPDAINAGGSTTALWRVLSPGRSIVVSGFMIGKIDVGGGQNKCVQSPDDKNEKFWKEIDEVVSLLQKSSLSDVGKVLRIGACLLLDDSMMRHIAGDGNLSRFVGDQLDEIALVVHSASPIFHMHYRDAINSILHPSLNGIPGDRSPSGAALQIMEDFMHRTLMRRVKQVFWDRTWIRNARFDALGVAPAAALQGDLLFVPRGCPFVMALHPKGDGTFTVVGPCWLYGFMHGEAVKLNEEGRIEEKDLVLI
ncbi:hypothetical protein CB0940_06998 [Cercospora beticola]|uniref:Heterokaryon incompatibility domain-containing protein n=1 Tax=Cercospora beticola TaxID=122368 RepID=A0A2G5H8E9_CERBT|nr:hypothetical protein CB0940_06998 [Cercospora beticola]PIA88808.1 hypothetical protein CB0940_06998 [Cercospora beticola]WPB02918.1 hypothetical protein RHO25_007554 [Cercospora beticola]CAK1358385.1 unnamed protein product [Cercospora beticola]